MFELRKDQKIIADLIPVNASVLDLGCGTGNLLHYLKKQKNGDVVGVDKDKKRLQACREKGISVCEMDINNGLSQYTDDNFDYVILNGTLQSLSKVESSIKEMMRIGKNVIITFPNFGHWKVRLHLLLTGRAPKSKELPFSWHNTPNTKYCSIKDFNRFCKRNLQLKYFEVRRVSSRFGRFFPNLFCSYGVYFIESTPSISWT